MKVPILLPNIFNHPFTYETTLNLKVGNYVVVPFGKSNITGVVWDEFEKKTNKQFSIRKVLSKIEVPALKKNTIKFSLNAEQKESLTFLKRIGDNYNVTVLEGITGSGKTLVYFERVRDIVGKGFQALILLPEIALTNQFSRRFKQFFGAEPAIWHSETSKKINQ